MILSQALLCLQVGRKRTCACLVFVSTGLLMGQYAKGQLTGALPKEQRAFELKREPNKDDTPGLLKNGGYWWRDVNVTQWSHRCIGKKSGGATVETITHSNSYPYVLHDFFGTFLGSRMRDKPLSELEVKPGEVREGDGSWNFVNWNSADGVASGKICVILVAKENGSYGGNVGWYRREGDRINTVMIFFDNLDGVPVQLIDKFLKDHPSTVTEQDFHGNGWVADDIRKWVNLLRLHKHDREMFSVAALRLRVYDRELFGVDAARLESDDPTTFDAALDAVSEGVEQWIKIRDARKRGNGK